MRKQITVTNVYDMNKALDYIVRDVEKRMVTAQVEIVAQCLRPGGIGGAESYVRWLTPRRLPSTGGGSYGKSHHARMTDTPYAEATGTCIGEAWNDHPWAAGVEWGTEEHIIMAKNPQGMKISKVLPVRSSGKSTPVSPPYGTKYKTLKPPKTAYKVEHPGARAFLIYGDTFKRVVGLIPRIVRKALKEAFK